ncbi:MAG: 5-formyltetrahydrofolate cyclo-ligase [Desulfovibrionales bacterium]
MVQPQDKTSLRKELAVRRRALSPEQVARRSSSVHKLLEGLDSWRRAREVMLYLPVNNEVDTWPLARKLWQRDVRVLLPRCRPGCPGVMDLACVAGDAEILPGSYGVPEPDPSRCQALESVSPDCIVVPGVGLDRMGFRMGYGAGYYDRFLSRPEVAGSLTIGLAYRFQVVDTLPRDPWDQPVDVLITETEVLWPR